MGPQLGMFEKPKRAHVDIPFTPTKRDMGWTAKHGCSFERLVSRLLTESGFDPADESLSVVSIGLDGKPARPGQRCILRVTKAKS